MSGTTISTGTTDHIMSFDIHVALTSREIAALTGFGLTSTHESLERMFATFITERLDAAMAKFDEDAKSPPTVLLMHDDDTCPFMWDEPHACNHTKEIRS